MIHDLIKVSGLQGEIENWRKLEKTEEGWKESPKRDWGRRVLTKKDWAFFKLLGGRDIDQKLSECVHVVSLSAQPHLYLSS